jgi:MerR family transcriptional regulator, heat shock protein HspR
MMRSDEDQPVYTMQVAAGLLGAHPQTLRNYERAGLIRPVRSAGNQRLYSAADIRRLRHLLMLARRYELTMVSLPLIEELRAGLEHLASLLAGPPDQASWSTAQTTVDELLALLQSSKQAAGQPG